MLEVTDKACARLTEVLDGHSARSVIRIIRKGGRMKMRLASEKPNDQTFDHNGRVVLVLDQRVSAHFAAGTLDLRETERGPKLHIRRRSADRRK
ncbi:MAG: hypothetical protein WBF93_18445 [Pirellulales bacterium]|nr:hypothetical protein [Pirellulales bacterium]